MKGFKKIYLGGIFFILFLIIFLPGYTKLQELRDRQRQLNEWIQKLKKENIILYQESQRLKEDPLYQEKILREKMGIVRKGEIPYRIEE
ncbi:MAG: septum formation initiator family protein [Candidatus Omnitrophica bacterium]|nr:septum formation initiator family protein [Candidatus Omnitrophota bacterium]